MLPTERDVLQFFIVILFTINGLHSYPRHQPSLGIINEFIGQDSNSPLIVVVDSNNQARTLYDERDLGQEQRKDHHVNYPGHYAAKFSEREYENALYELLRTNERMPKMQQAKSIQNRKIGKNRNNGKNEKRPLFLPFIPIAAYFGKMVVKELAKTIVQNALDKVGENYDIKETTDAITVALDILTLIPFP